MTVEYTELEELRNDVLTCKALWHHAMEKNPSPQFIDGEVARLAFRILCLRCTRCGRERYDYLDRNGGRIGRYYKNPNGYPRVRRYDSDTLNRELIRRSLLVTRYSRSRNAR